MPPDKAKIQLSVISSQWIAVIESGKGGALPSFRISHFAFRIIEPIARFPDSDLLSAQISVGRNDLQIL